MRRLQKDQQAISIIIGALMLTVIVVSAATSFAVFTSQKQKELQDADFAKLRRDLEEIAITSISDITYQSVPAHLETISFIITNLHAADSTISSLSINGNYLRQFYLIRQDLSVEEWKINSTTGHYELKTMTSSLGAQIYNGTLNESNKKYAYYPLTIASRERVVLCITNASTTGLFLIKEIYKNDAITFSLYTSLTKEFTKTFIPPTAIIRVITESQWNSTTNDYKSLLILDGSLSDHPGEDAYILSWNWSIDGVLLSNLGRKVRAPDSLLVGPNHTLTLTVTDNFGMTATSTITYP